MARGVERTIDELRSPMRKLVQFFQRSRDNWKEKCQKAKNRNKLLGNQVRAVEKSRERWRCRAEQAEQQVQQLERELDELKRDICRG